MIIRQARMQDAAQICALLNLVIRDTLITFTTKERGEAEIAADIALRWQAFQVAENNGQVVGFASFFPFRDGPGYTRSCEVTIHLAAESRRAGMGRALLQKLEQVAAQQGVHVMVAGISAANPQGIAFHAACGYTEVGRMSEVGFKAGRYLDLVLMQKILPKAGEGADSGATLGADSPDASG